MEKTKVPIAFFLRRIQSLTGLGLVIFLLEHLFTNSQVALFLDSGNGFVRGVNFLQSIPFLNFVEIVLIGMPIVFHASLGVKYIITGDLNSFKTKGTKPSLYQYKRNKAYSMQRISSYILGVLLVFHVVQMRFIDSPKLVNFKGERFYFVKVKNDPKIEMLANKLKFDIYLKDEIKNLDEKFQKMKLKDNQILAFSKKNGSLFLLQVRDSFKNPLMVGLYTIFVLAAAFHGFNGLWTFLITWGFIITNRSQSLSLKICFLSMIVVLSLGLMAIWSSFLY